MVMGSPATTVSGTEPAAVHTNPAADVAPLVHSATKDPWPGIVVGGATVGAGTVVDEVVVDPSPGTVVLDEVVVDVLVVELSVGTDVVDEVVVDVLVVELSVGTAELRKHSVRSQLLRLDVVHRVK